MKTEEFYQIYIDGDWKEDVETKEEVMEKVEYWINHIDYFEDELLDLVYESDVSTIKIVLVVREVEEEK